MKVNWELKIDQTTRAMLQPILQINFQVQQFSLSYLEEDPHRQRYHLLQNQFVLTMLLLVTADNQFLQFVGWEGVGLASYLQINFWYTRIYANQAGQKAFLTNRIGDWGQTQGLQFYWVMYGSFSIEMQSQSQSSDLLGLMGLGITLGAITKSAQIGLHSWLTRSMEGPTPVSALQHAATMVTAGVYLLARMYIILEWSHEQPLLLAWLGGLSAQGGAIGGLQEQDIKKIIAYSTISQLGYMFIALGFGYYNLSLWHLVNHACFKALLFLSGGALIHSIFGIQDIRRYGRLPNPLMRICFIIGNLSIMAIPFMTGWYTKDEILLEVYRSHSLQFLFIYLAAIITASYSIKQFLASFKSLSRLSSNVYSTMLPGASHLDARMSVSMIIQSLCAVGLGYLGVGLFGRPYGPDALASHHVGQASTTLFLSLILLLSILSILMQARLMTQTSPNSWNILDLLDLIYLRFLNAVVAPASAYLYRNYQGYLEVQMGAIGVIRLVEALAFRLELQSANWLWAPFLSIGLLVTSGCV